MRSERVVGVEKGARLIRDNKRVISIGKTRDVRGDNDENKKGGVKSMRMHLEILNFVELN